MRWSRLIPVALVAVAACSAPDGTATPSTTATTVPGTTAPDPTGSTTPATAPATTSTTAATTTTVDDRPRDRLPEQPFAADSIWRRAIPPDAAYVDVSDVLGDPAHAIGQVGLDLVTLCATDPAAPLVNVERSSGWQRPGRSTSSGEVLYQRHLTDDACTDVTFNPIGNALFVLFDPTTSTADLGIGGWREPGGPLLSTAPDGRDAHGLDVFDGDGTVGYGRASLLPALGGLLRAGELDHGIDHALAVNLSGTILSQDQHFVWPARAADGNAPVVYRGTNPALAMGTLLAVPPSVDLEALTWRTPQGRNLAAAAQRYGWYVVDIHLVEGLVQFGMETGAAQDELGLRIDAATARQTYDTTMDLEGLTADVALIASLLQAVPQTG